MPQQPASEDGSLLVAADDPSRVWLPELVQRFAGFLSGNEVACVLRLVNKATAAQFGRPQDRTVRLSQPVPHAEFARRWVGEDAMRSLAWSRRCYVLLPCLTARSGCIVNLEALLATGDGGYVLQEAVLSAAAAAGRLEVCRWLRQQGCPYAAHVLVAAAGAGQRAVCEWLLADGCPHNGEAAFMAARGGHVGIMDWLQSADASPNASAELLLRGAAHGCDLPTVQRLYQAMVENAVGEQLLDDYVVDVLGLSAGSPTADWRAKVEWLEGRGAGIGGHHQRVRACCQAAPLPDGRARLEWLQQRGYPLTSGVAVSTASSGNVDALSFVLAAGVVVDGKAAKAMVRHAGENGQLAFLQALLHMPGFGVPILLLAAPMAAANGHLPVLEWLAEIVGVPRVGAPTLLKASLSVAAARSGRMDVLAWLHAHGCPWGKSVYARAAGHQHVSDEQLEWLAANGCPM